MSFVCLLLYFVHIAFIITTSMLEGIIAPVPNSRNPQSYSTNTLYCFGFSDMLGSSAQAGTEDITETQRPPIGIYRAS
jgi:hypothetical protein